MTIEFMCGECGKLVRHIFTGRYDWPESRSHNAEFSREHHARDCPGRRHLLYKQAFDSRNVRSMR